MASKKKKKKRGRRAVVTIGAERTRTIRRKKQGKKSYSIVGETHIRGEGRGGQRHKMLRTKREWPQGMGGIIFHVGEGERGSFLDSNYLMDGTQNTSFGEKRKKTYRKNRGMFVVCGREAPRAPPAKKNAARSLRLRKSPGGKTTAF